MEIPFSRRASCASFAARSSNFFYRLFGVRYRLCGGMAPESLDIHSRWTERGGCDVVGNVVGKDRGEKREREREREREDEEGDEVTKVRQPHHPNERCGESGRHAL